MTKLQLSEILEIEEESATYALTSNKPINEFVYHFNLLRKTKLIRLNPDFTITSSQGKFFFICYHYYCPNNRLTYFISENRSYLSEFTSQKGLLPQQEDVLLKRKFPIDYVLRIVGDDANKIELNTKSLKEIKGLIAINPITASNKELERIQFEYCL